MTFNEIQRLIYQDRKNGTSGHLNEGFDDELFSSPAQSTTKSADTLLNDVQDNTHTFRFAQRVEVSLDRKNDVFELKYLAWFSFIEHNVQNFRMLGDTVQFTKVTVSVLPNRNYKKTVTDFKEFGPDDLTSEREFGIALQQLVDDNIDTILPFHETIFAMDFFIDFAFNPDTAWTSWTLFQKDFLQMTNALHQFGQYLTALAQYNSTNGSEGGFAVYSNNLEPGIDETPDFKVGCIGNNSGLGIQRWTSNTVNKFYADFMDREFTNSQNPDNLITASKMCPVLLRLHRLKHMPETQQHYEYHLVGFRTDNNGYKCYLGLRPKVLTSKYANITEMTNWFKDNLIDAMSDADRIRTVQNQREVTIELRISVGPDFVPNLNWPDKSKKYSNIITHAAGPGKAIVFKISFHDNDFERLGTHKFGRFSSKQFGDAMAANAQYRRYLEFGYFGRTAQKNYDKESEI